MGNNRLVRHVYGLTDVFICSTSREIFWCSFIWAHALARTHMLLRACNHWQHHLCYVIQLECDGCKVKKIRFHFSVFLSETERKKGMDNWWCNKSDNKWKKKLLFKGYKIGLKWRDWKMYIWGVGLKCLKGRTITNSVFSVPRNWCLLNNSAPTQDLKEETEESSKDHMKMYLSIFYNNGIF